MSGNTVRIRYELADTQSDPASIHVAFRVPGRSAPATPALQDPQHEGVSGLTTSPTGIEHSFVWDWRTDLGATAVANVTLLLQPSDATGAGSQVSSPAITIRTSAAPPPASAPPVVRIYAPTGALAVDDVEIVYDLSHPHALPANVTVSYSVAGATSAAATSKPADPRHSGVVGLSTSPSGISYSFVWDWRADIALGSVSDVTVVVQASASSGAVGQAVSSPFSLSVPAPSPPAPAGVPPRAIVQTPSASIVAPEMLIEFALIDPDHDPADVDVEFSIQSGAFMPATPMVSDPRHGGTRGLTTDPAGSRHVFVWDWPSDIVAGAAVGVVLRVTPSDLHGTGAPAISGSFDILGSAPPPPVGTRPAVRVISPAGASVTGTVVVVEYEISDPDSQLADVEVSYSRGAAYTPATADTSDPRHSGVAGLPTSGVGVRHTFVWAWQADLGAAPVAGVELRLVASDAAGLGPPVTIAPLSLSPPTSPAPTVNTPEVIVRSPAGDIGAQPDFPVELLTFDDTGTPVDVALDFRINGERWSTAAPVVADPTHEGTQGLSASAQGDSHLFVWDLAADLGAPPVRNIELRAVAVNSNGTSPPSLSRLFSLDARPTSPPPPPALGIVLAPMPTIAVGDAIVIDFTLAGPAGDPLSLDVEYSVGGGAFAPATARTSDPRHSGTSGLNASAVGESFRFVWDWLVDEAGPGLIDVVVRFVVRAFSGGSASTQTSTVNVQVHTPRYELRVTAGGQISAAPGLRLPSGSIEALLTNHGAPVPNVQVAVHVLEGGGGFPEPRPPAAEQLASRVNLATDANGKVSLPEFVLGRTPGMNRLLLQSRHAETRVSVEGTYANTSLVPISPASGSQEWVATGKVDLIAQLQDASFPGARIHGMVINAEIVSGGGWLGLSEGRGQADAYETGDALLPGTWSWVHSAVSVVFYLSALEERSEIRLSLRDHRGPSFTFRIDSRKMRLFSYRVGALTAENLGRISTGWLSRIVRLGVTDDPAVTVSGPVLANTRTWGTYEILAERLPSLILSELHPEHRAGYWGTPALVVRPWSAGPVGWRLSLPDFPDSNTYEVSGEGVSRLQGGSVTVTSPPWFVQAENGGTFDDYNGVELRSPSGDVQFVGPQSTAVHPFRLEVVTRALQPVDRRRLRAVKLYFKVRTSPASSRIDDPSWFAPLEPGTVGLSPGSGVDELEVSVPATPGVHPVSVYFNSHPHNTDNFLDVTVRVTVSEKDSNDVWHTFDRHANILARAIFFAPRLSITKRVGNDFGVPGEEGLIPTPVVDSGGNPLPPDPNREYFYELRTHTSTPNVVQISQPGGAILELTKVDTTPIRTLYRSRPVVFYLENPQAFGLMQFSLPQGRDYVRVSHPDWLYLDAKRAVVPNPNDNNYYSPIRPFTFLNAEPLRRRSLEPQLPRPRIIFENLNRRDEMYPIAIENGAAVLELRGSVRDLVADLTPAGAANITTATVNGQPYPLTGASEAAGPLRPHAWRGDFAAKVPLVPGMQTIQLSATNALGGDATVTLAVDLIDTRNDYDNPDVNAMKARVQRLEAPATDDSKGLVIVNFRAPTTRQPGTVPPQIAVDVESVAAHPAATVEDSATVRLARASGLENNFTRLLLAVPSSVDAARVTALRGSGAAIIRHTPGTRLRISGQSLPHVGGSTSLQWYLASRSLEIRVLVKKPNGTFEERDQLEVGDEWTIEARDRDQASSSLVSLIVAICDRLGRISTGDERVLQVELGPGTGGWSRLNGYIDATGNLVATDTLHLVGESAPAPSGPAVRSSAHSMLRLGRAIGEFVESSWPIFNEPRRQEVGGSPVPTEPHHSSGARDGALGTVVVATGESALREVDCQLVGRAMYASFGRSYRSFSSYEGPLGVGWTHTYNSWIRRLDADRFRWVDSDAVPREFRRNASTNEFDSPAGIFARLEVRSPSLIALVWRGGTTDYYARQDGAADLFTLVGTSDRTHNHVRLVVDQVGMLATIIDDLEQRVHILYDADRRIASVSDEAGRAWVYRYHAASSTYGPEGCLAGVRSPVVTTPHNAFPAGRERQYDYEDVPANSLKHFKLKAIQDPEGSVTRASSNPLSPLISMTHRSDGRVEAQTYGNGSYRFTYAGSTTSVRNRRGHTAEYDFRASPSEPHLATLPVETRLPLISGFDTFRFDHDRHGQLTKHESTLGTVIEYTFDSQATDPRQWGNLRSLRHTPRGGNPDPIVTTVGLTDFAQEPAESRPSALEATWTYEPRYQQIKTVTDYLGNTTTYTYDYETAAVDTNRGNPYQRESATLTTGVHSQANGTRRTRFWYNNYGQIIQEANPLGVVTRYRYYPRSDLRGSLTGSLVAAANEPTGRLAEIVTDDVDPNVARSSLLTAPETATVRQTYDAWGDIREFRDKRGFVVTEIHNEVGHVIERRTPDGGRETFWHDVNGRPQKTEEWVQDIGFPAGATRRRSRAIAHDYVWDRLGNHRETTEDSGGLALKTTFTYDEEDNLWKIFSPNANRASAPDRECYAEYSYDPQNRVASVTEAPGLQPQWKQSIDYDEEGNVLFVTERTGAVGSGDIVKSYLYDSWGRLTKTTDPLDNFERVLHDANGNVTFIAKLGSVDGTAVGPNAKVLQAAFYFRNEGGSIVASQVKAFRWIQQGGAWQRQAIDSGNLIEKTEFDEALRAVAIVDANNFRTEIRYNGSGSPRGAATTHGQSNARYDLAGNLKEVDIPTPNGGRALKTVRSYDSMNRLISVQQDGGGTTLQFYDTLGRLRLVEDPVGNRTYRDYDGVGRTVKVTREKRAGGRRTTASGSVNPLENPESTTAEFDENGNVLNLKDWRDRVIISHTYGSRNERLTTTLPDDGFPVLGRPSTGPNAYSYDYWENGSLKGINAPDGWRVEHGYDDAGRLSERKVVPVPQASPTGVRYGTTRQTFLYDGVGRCIRATDDNGSSTKEVVAELAYDSLGNTWMDRQTENFTTSGSDLTVIADYRDDGSLALVRHPGTGTASIRYVPDSSGRLHRVYNNQSPTQSLLRFSYDGTFATKVDLDNDHSRVMHHDSEGVLERLLHLSTVAGEAPAATVPGLQPNEKVVVADQIRLSSRRLPVVVSDLRRNEAALSLHDSLGRIRVQLSGVDGDDLTSRPRYGVWHHYDSRGNAAAVEEGRIKPEAGPNNQYLLFNPSTFVREFNVAGQLGRSRESYVEAGTLRERDLEAFWDRRGNLSRDHRYEYHYDDFNRLVEVMDRLQGTRIIENRFDAFGRRILKDGTRYLYHEERLIEERPGHGSWIHRYFHEGEGVFMIQREALPGGNLDTFRIHRDRGGSPLFLSDSTGRVVEQYQYHPLTGEPRYLDENGAEITTPMGNPFLFQGMYYDTESKLYLAGARFYHPHFRTMMQRDPDGADMDGNPYAFVRGNPGAFKDPSGRIPFAIPLAMAAAGALIGAGFVVAVAIAEWADGDRASPFPSWGEVGWGALTGAVLGLGLYAAPSIGYTLAVFGAIESGIEIGRGNYWKGGLIGAASILGGFGTRRGITKARELAQQRQVSASFEQAVAAIPDQMFLRPELKVLRGGGSRGGEAPATLRVLEGGGQTARGTPGRGMAGSYQLRDAAGVLKAEGIHHSGGGLNRMNRGRHFEDNVARDVGELAQPGDVLTLGGPYDYCPQCNAGNVLGRMAAEHDITIWYFSGEGTNRLFLPSRVNVTYRPNGSVLWRHVRSEELSIVAVRNYFRVRTRNPKTGRLVLANVPGKARNPGGRLPNWPPQSDG